MNEHIGFVGLGNMGLGMAGNLVKAGYKVYGYDIDETKAEVASSLGVSFSSIDKIAEHCKTVILCLPHPTATEEVVFEQLLQGASTVECIIETSTLTPEIVSSLAIRLHDLNIQFLSAPMVGGKDAAANKTVHFLVEGEESVFTLRENLFQAMGARADFMGNVPSATLAKIVFNISRYANIAAGIESFRLLRAYQANTEAIFSSMIEQSLDNFGQVWSEDLKSTMTGGEMFKPSQVPTKDLALFSDLAKTHELSDEFIQAIRNTYLSMQ